MPYEVGQELEEFDAQSAPKPAERENAFTKFFKNPSNIATALVFGAALAQPRTEGRDGLATFMQRATGAAAFRGALQGGQEKQKLAREQTAFERAQVEKENAQRERQISVQEQGVGLQREGLGIQREGVEVQREGMQLDQGQFEAELQNRQEDQQLDRAMQLQLARIQAAPTQKDLVQVAMTAVPYLLDTMEFDEGLTSQQKIQIATDEALKGVMTMRAVLDGGGQMVRNAEGLWGFQTPDGVPVPSPITPTTKVPEFDGTGKEEGPPERAAETPTERAARIKSEQEASPFGSTFSQRRELRSAENTVVQERAARRQAMATLKNRALGLQRLLQIGGRPTPQHVKEIAFFTDMELQEMGLNPQAITGLRRLAEQLPTE